MPFSVGAVGPRELIGARKVLLRASISRVVREMAEALAPLMNLRAHPGSDVTRPRLTTAMTGEGDLLIAEEALAAGYVLSLVLPRPREEQLAHLGEALESRALRALEQAVEVSEPASLFGAGQEPAEMLGGQGDVRSRLLTASDLVLCIWDGEADPDPETPGGAAVSAAEQGIPVVWITSTPPHSIRLHSLTEPHPQSWNRILPPDVLECLERLTQAPEAGDRTTRS